MIKYATITTTTRSAIASGILSAGGIIPHICFYTNICDSIKVFDRIRGGSGPVSENAQCRI
jgi:hypothetical protein